MTAVWQRAVGRYRREGTRGLVSAVQGRLPGSAMSASYQEKVEGSLEERWRLIDGVLPPDARTLLDIGCDKGGHTAHYAQRGLWAVGVDRSRDLVAEAQQRHRDLEHCGFMVMDLGPDDIDRFPTFDVVLLLSVHQHWIQAHGPETAGAMLRQLVRRAAKVLVFETASRRSRFGDHPPAFEDNDEASVTAYQTSYLEEHVGGVVREIRPLGKASCVGEREPYRWSYALLT